MVQKKGPDRHDTTPRSRICPSRGERKHSPPPRREQHSETDGVADLRKKMKKARSMKRISELEDLGSHLGRQHVQQHRRTAARKKTPTPTLAGASNGSSPNYMKSTTSSDARKERSRVSFLESVAGGKRGSSSTPRRSGVSSPFTASSSSSSSKSSQSCNKKTTTTNHKLAKVLSRRSSLKLTRPLMKKILGAPLFSKINASRATCSSTIKDSRFPTELELSSGATESEGTSAMRVCPYTYCSLNGHGHEPLPPLKRFVSSRKRLLKTQKSVRLKGLPSFRRRGSGKGGKCLTIPPLTNGVGDDFFVEIFAKLSENTVELAFDQGDCAGPAHGDIDDDKFSGNFSETASVGDTGKSVIDKISDDDGDGDGWHLEISTEKNPEQRSESSGSVLEFPVVEYKECNNQVKLEEAEFGYNDDPSEFRTLNESNEMRSLEGTEVQNLVFDDVQDLFVVGDDHEYLDDGFFEEHVREIAVDNQVHQTDEGNGNFKNYYHFSSSYNSECEDACPENTKKEGIEIIKKIILEEQSQEAAVGDNSVEDEHVGNDTLGSEVPQPAGADLKREAVAVHTSVGVPCDEIPEPDSADAEIAKKNENDENGDLNSNDSYSLVSMGIEKESFEETANATNLEPEYVQEMDSNKTVEVELAERGLADKNSKIEESKSVEDMETEKEEVVRRLLYDDKESKNENRKLDGMTCIPEILDPEHSLVVASPSTTQANEANTEPENEAPTCYDEVISGSCHEWGSLGFQLDKGSFGNDTARKNENGQVEGTICLPRILAPDHSLTEANSNVAQGKQTITELKNGAPTCDEEDIAGLCHEFKLLEVQLENDSSNKDMETKNENDEVEETIFETEILGLDHSLTEAEPKNEALKCNEEFKAGLCHECNSVMDHLGNSSLKGNGEKSEIGQLDEDNTSATNKSTSTSRWADGIICGTQMDNVINPDEYETYLFTGPEQSEESTADTDLLSISSSNLSESDAELKSKYSYTRKKVDDHQDELKPFNPRAPNFLPVESDPEAEMIDLRHQMMDDRKNAEEWMNDYALQRTVSRLARARKRKVELLVEAFETVAPETECEAQNDDHGGAVLAHSRPMQACS